MFKVNNERPSSIYVKYNTNPNARYMVNYVRVKYNGSYKYIWSQEYTLTINSNPNATIVVERLSSDLEGASTGVLSNGDKIYYEDSIKITVTPNNGAVFNSMTINSNTYTSNTQTLNISGNIEITVDANAASWHVIFSGTEESTHCTSQFETTYRMNFAGLLANKETRVSGYLKKENNTTIQSFTSVTLPYSANYNSTSQTIQEVTENGTLFVTLRRPIPTFTNKPPYFVITKIEQFY